MNKCKEIFRRCLALFGYGRKQDTENDIVEETKEYKPIKSKKKLRKCAYCLLIMDKNKLDSTKFVSIDKPIGNNETIHLDFCKIGCLLEYSARPYL